MIFLSSIRGVSIRIEVVGGSFDGEIGEARRKMFQSLVQVLLAVGIAKEAQLEVLAEEHSNALVRALRRIKSEEKDFEAD